MSMIEEAIMKMMMVVMAIMVKLTMTAIVPLIMEDPCLILKIPKRKESSEVLIDHELSEDGTYTFNIVIPLLARMDQYFLEMGTRKLRTQFITGGASCSICGTLQENQQNLIHLKFLTVSPIQTVLRMKMG